MAKDLGEWDKETYELQYKRKLNEIEKEKINRDKIILKKRETIATIEGYDCDIDEKNKLISDLKKEEDWLKSKIEENNGR